MRDINELGPRPYRQSSLGPVREEEIQAFESHYSISLPTSFRKFLYALNGGRVRLRRYPDPVEGYGEINDFYGLGRKAADDEHALVNGWDIGNLWGKFADYSSDSAMASCRLLGMLEIISYSLILEVLYHLFIGTSLKQIQPISLVRLTKSSSTHFKRCSDLLVHRCDKHVLSALTDDNPQ